MKTLTTLVLSSLIAISVLAGGESEKIHEEYGKKQGVITMSFSKEMMEAFDVDFDVDEALKNFKGDFTAVKMLIISDETPEGIAEEIQKRLEKYGYKHIDIEDDDMDDFVIYTDKRKRKFNEIHLLSKGKDGGMLISLYGNFEITDK